MTVLCAGLAAPHAGWAAIDELALLLARYFEAELLSPASIPGPLWRRLAGRPRPTFATQTAAGGDVLMVVARGPQDLALISSIPDARKRYARIHAFVTDSYFQAGFVQETRLYDSITVTAHEDMAYPTQRFGVQVHQLHQGADCLQWAPTQWHARDIDLIAYGRTPPSFHRAFMQRFHAARSPHLYLHSPLGHLAGPDIHLERGMLFKLLQRTGVSLAFHLLVEPEGSRPRSMMVTSRWLESLLSGCIVAGHRPISRMATDMLNWEGATVELAADPEQAADALERLLAHPDDMQMQRQRNVAQMLTQHDWRHRMQRMCGLFGWDVPARLQEDLNRLQERATPH